MLQLSGMLCDTGVFTMAEDIVYFDGITEKGKWTNCQNIFTAFC